MQTPSKQINTVIEDPWQGLKQFTNARIALGSTGVSLPTKQVLQLRMAHANARDAVYAALAPEALMQQLQPLHSSIISLQSECVDRTTYLQRPDSGRKLNAASIQVLQNYSTTKADVAIVIADGLSATAIHNHVVPVLTMLLPRLYQLGISIAPITIVTQARVAIADGIGSLLKASLSLIFIGERPGLSSPDSMGVYLTYQPQPGLTDESRNCISNIQSQGLSYTSAVEKIMFLLQQSLRLKLSGVQLKEDILLID